MSFPLLIFRRRTRISTIAPPRAHSASAGRAVFSADTLFAEVSFNDFARHSRPAQSLAASVPCLPSNHDVAPFSFLWSYKVQTSMRNSATANCEENRPKWRNKLVFITLPRCFSARRLVSPVSHRFNLLIRTVPRFVTPFFLFCPVAALGSRSAAVLFFCHFINPRPGLFAFVAPHGLTQPRSGVVFVIRPELCSSF